MAAKCPKCEFENSADTVFCGKCGTRIRGYVPDSPGSGTCPQNSKKPLAGLKNKISVTKTLESTPKGLGKGELFAGRFELIEELGAGGMGIVYRAYDKEVGEEIALKALHPEIARDEQTVDRFRNEIKLARKIGHRNVCRMHELHQDGKQLFITMEYVSGRDLKALIKETGALSTGKAISIAKQVAEGLAEAHDLGVIHRDLKPQNIMVDKEGLAKIMDFGIARSLRSAGMTAEGMIIGTPEYMAPEQVEGVEADQRTDMYAFGAILFEMVTGRVPFEGDSPLSVAYKHKNEIPPPPRELNAQVPEPFNQLILRCLEKEKENRYQTADDLLADLVRIEDGLPISERVILKTRPTIRIAREKPRGLKRFLVPALVFASLAIAAVVVFRLLVRTRTAYPSPSENSIAVISFENQTGDEAFDSLRMVIPNLLITNLENSGFFQVATWERMRDLLKQMDQGDVDIITSELGFQACRKDGIKALVLGSYAKVGETFVTDVKVLDVETKQLLKSASSRGEGADSIFKQIDDLSRRISEGVGVSPQTIEAAELNILDVTTGSLEAYKYYQEGLEDYRHLKFQVAEENFQKAVDIDPSFAMGYFYLAWAQAGGGGLNNPFIDPSPFKKSMALAKKYSQKTTEKESLLIEIGTAMLNYDYKSVKDYSQRLVDKYPKEKSGYQRLWTCYIIEQDFEKAKEAVEKGLELDPTNAHAYWALAYTNAALKDQSGTASAAKKYIAVYPDDWNAYHSGWEVHATLGLYDEAQTFLDEGLARNPEWSDFHVYSGFNCLLKKDADRAREEFRTYFDSQPKDIYYRYGFYMGCFYLLEGKYQRAVSEFRRRVEAAQREKNARFEMVFRIQLGRMLVAQRKYDEAIDEYDEAERLSKKLYNEDFNPASLFANHLAGSALVHKGDYQAAQERIDLIQSMIQKGNYSVLHSIFEHLLRAELFTAQRKLEAAQEELSWGQDWNPFQEFPRQTKLVAVIDSLRGQFEKAAEEYQNSFRNCQVISSPILWTDMMDFWEEHSKVDYNLAKTYEQMGETAKAAAHYKKFLDLWKDADPGIPEFEDAKERLGNSTI